MDRLSKHVPDAWRDTDGTIYSFDMPASMAPPGVGGPVDSSVALTPDDEVYGAFEASLLPWFDYKGIEVPSGQSPDSDADAG